MTKGDGVSLRTGTIATMDHFGPCRRIQERWSFFDVEETKRQVKHHMLMSWPLGNGRMFQHPTAAIPYNQQRRINHYCSLHHNWSRNDDPSLLMTIIGKKTHSRCDSILFESSLPPSDAGFRCPAIRAMGNVRGTPCGRRRVRSCCRVHPQSHLSQNDVSSGTADSWRDERVLFFIYKVILGARKMSSD
jgi:hypothetical protein